MIHDVAISALDYWRSRSGRAPCNIYGVEFRKNDMTENPDMMPKMMLFAPAGKVFAGAYHCGALRFRMTWLVGEILIYQCYDGMCTAKLSWAGIEAA